MKTKILALTIATVAIFSSGCSLLDPTEVVNPNLTEEDLRGKGLLTMKPWLGGMTRNLALAYNEIVTPNEILSDNYANTKTYYNQAFDFPRMNVADADINDLIQYLSRLRSNAVYGLEVVKPADPNATPTEEAELYFYKGLSHLWTAELFVSAPVVGDGKPVPPAVQFDSAIVNFKKAFSLSTDADLKTGYNIVLARAYYYQGDKANARKHAADAIAGNNQYVRSVEFDPVNTFTPAISNILQDALYRRGTFDDLQPLPRLDFLDPKCYTISSSEDSPIPLAKIEEAYLILAEADVADNQLPAALNRVKDLIGVVNGRNKATFDDQAEGRDESNPGSRPNRSAVRVAASAGEPLIAGLVLERGAPLVTVPVISGTSISAANVTAANYPTVDAALELIYLLRQEIFIGEGRRAVDLGFRYPVSFNEIVSNPNIETGDPATVGRIPAFIPKNQEMDAFTYDKAAGTCTIKHNMNKVIVTNKASQEVVPFF